MDKNLLIKRIALEGKKISDLDLTEHISGEELLEVTQDNKSKAVSIDTILESASTGIIKIPRKDITLEKAISLVKDYQKSFGTIIHFHNVESGSWEMYRYTNPSIKEFDDITNWEYINISNTFKGLFPTEKDLLLKFPKPAINDYALVGSTVDSADTYFANKPGTWEKSNNKIKNKLCRFAGITSRDANIKLECSPKQSNSTCSRPYRRGNSVYWRLEDGSEEWLFDITDDVYLVCPETPDEEVFDVFVRTTEGGSYSPYPVITPVPANTTITVTATPEEGYVFKHWDLGNTKVTTPTFTLTITEDFLTLGVFEKIKEEVPVPPAPKTKYTITTSTAGGGITTPSSISVEDATLVEIAAIPNEGKVFKHWLLDNTVISKSAIYQAPATSNKHYIAVFEDKQVSPTPDPTPQPTPSITYSIEADTTPVNITIDDNNKTREVCFSYKVVKHTTINNNTTNEYVSNYTSNRDKERFCVTTSENMTLPLNITVGDSSLSKTFTINVTDNRTPDRGYFEIDYPNSVGIVETPEGPQLVNQCYTDGSGGGVTHVIKLTERSNPFTTIPTLPQGIEVTLSEDKKTMTIKTICNLITTITGKIFEVFDFFKRKIQVLLGTAKTPVTIDDKLTVTVIHNKGEYPEETEVYKVDSMTSFQVPYKYKDSHDISNLSMNGTGQPSQEYNRAYVIEEDTVFRVQYRRKAPVEKVYHTVTIMYRGVGLTRANETYRVEDGGTFQPNVPEIPGYSRLEIQSNVPGRDTEVYLTHPDYVPTPFTNIKSDITIAYAYVQDEEPEDPSGTYTLTISKEPSDSDGLIKIVVPDEPMRNYTTKEYPAGSQFTIEANNTRVFRFIRWKTTEGITLSTEPTYTSTINSNLTIIAEFANGYDLNLIVMSENKVYLNNTDRVYVTSSKEGRFSLNEKVTLTAVQNVNNYTFSKWIVDNIEVPNSSTTLELTMDSNKSVQAIYRLTNTVHGTDSYGKPLPFRFKPAIIDQVLFSHPTLEETGNFGSGDYISIANQKNDFALYVGDSPASASLFPITISDGVTTRTYTAGDEKPYADNMDHLANDSTFSDINYYNKLRMPNVRVGSSNPKFYVYNYKESLKFADNKFLNSLTESIAKITPSREDMNHFDSNYFEQENKKIPLLPYEKKEIAVTIKGEVYRFKPEAIETIRVYTKPFLKEKPILIYPWNVPSGKDMEFSFFRVPEIVDASELPNSNPSTPTPAPQPPVDNSSSASTREEISDSDVWVEYNRDTLPHVVVVFRNTRFPGRLSNVGLSLENEGLTSGVLQERYGEYRWEIDNMTFHSHDSARVRVRATITGEGKHIDQVVESIIYDNNNQDYGG